MMTCSSTPPGWPSAASVCRYLQAGRRPHSSHGSSSGGVGGEVQSAGCPLGNQIGDGAMNSAQHADRWLESWLAGWLGWAGLPVQRLQRFVHVLPMQVEAECVGLGCIDRPAG